MNKVLSLILSAGMGSRMKSKTNKNLHMIAGRPMVSYIIQAAEEAGVEDTILVIGKDADKVRNVLGEKYQYVYQKELLGTGHAVMQAQSILESYSGNTVMVLLGDGPVITSESLKKMLQEHKSTEAKVTLLTTEVEDPTGYGRIVRNEENQIIGIVEEADASFEQKQIKEVWFGLSCYQVDDLLESLEYLSNDNAQGEYYLTETISYFANNKQKIASVQALSVEETMNVNDRVSLAKAEQIITKRHKQDVMYSGVTIVSPDNTYIAPTVEIGRDTIILPFTYLAGRCTIGEDCLIGPYAHIEDSTIKSSVKIERSTVRGSVLDEGVEVGPFAYLRPGTHLCANSKAGRFVEIKNSEIGEGSKVPHLSYVGDTDAGSGVNFGAGTIVVNYDGHKKHRTTVEDGAFIGCNSNLVAPVKVGTGAYVAAGSTITKNIPKDALAIARGKQVNKAEWAAKRRAQWEKEER